MTDALSAHNTAPPEQGTRITVALIAKSADELADEVRDSGLSKTDIVNRAISLYRFVQQSARGRKEMILKAPDGSAERVILM